MKTRQTDEWNNPWSDSERVAIEQLAQKIKINVLCEQASEGAEVLRGVQADIDTQLATMALIGNLSEDLLGSVGERVPTLVREARRLIAEEAKWLSFLKLDTEDGQRKAKSHHMMLLTMMQDMRVILLLLAHQLIRMRYLKSEPTDIQRAVSLETQSIYVPLANRLGIGHIKWELEDLAFRFLHADEYKKIAKALEERRADREHYIDHVITELKALLTEHGIQAEVYGRPKHIYSIWRKMEKKHLSFSELYDVRAVRVIASGIESCYAALSLVHSHWRFIPKEYDDYIAAPKPNRYQSLHTAVYGPDDKVVEIQIRTWEMHKNAELGVAAHWRYKEGSQSDSNLDQQIESWRRLLKEESDEAGTIADAANADTIYVLTPQGHVIALSQGATPLDFAYHIHTNLGHRCRGAKVNGQMVPLTTSLKSGQQVEVITAKEGVPSRDWMNPSAGYIKTSRAMQKVRQWFKQQFHREDVERGKAVLNKELTASEMINTDWLAIATKFNLKTIDDFFAAVGKGDIGAKQVANTIHEKRPVVEPEPVITGKPIPKKKGGKGAIDVDGIGDLLTHFARCCKPVPGDEILGFITKGRGVSIHRASCVNAQKLLRDSPDRFISVNWGAKQPDRFEVDVLVEAIDRQGLLRDITSILAGEEVNVLAANTYTNKATAEASIRLTLELEDMEQLQRALTRISQLRNVLSAVRAV